MEVLVVIGVLFILSALLFPALVSWKKNSSQHVCLINLKNITLDYRVWAGDHNDKYPMQFSATNSSATELTLVGSASANFQVISNELSWPGYLHCPADTNRIAATNFTTDFNNNKISYFVGLDVDETHPQTLLSGDDNFEIGGVPVKSGLLKLSTNVSVSWAGSRHKFAGNIGLADGSVCEVTTSGLQQAFQQTGVATNRLAIP